MFFPISIFFCSESATSCSVIVDDQQDENRQPVSSEKPSSSRKSFLPVCWQSSDPPSAREILLHTLLRINFSGASDLPFTSRQPTEGLKTVMAAANSILDEKSQLGVVQESTYLQLAKARNSRVGKLRDHKRWVRFSSITANVIKWCAVELESCLTGPLSNSLSSKILSAVNEHIGNWILDSATSNPGTGSSPYEIDHPSRVCTTANQPRLLCGVWSSKVIALCFHSFGESSCHSVRSVVVDNTLHVTFRAFGKPDTFSDGGISETLRSDDDVQSLLAAVGRASECSGCSHEKYQPLLATRIDGDTLYGEDSSVVAKLEETWVPNRCIRTVACEFYIRNGTRCKECSLFDGTLRRSLSRAKESQLQENDPNTKYTPHAHLTRLQLLDRVKESNAKLSQLQRNYDCLRKKQAEMVTASSEYDDLFHRLEAGMGGLQEKLKEPHCMWEGCSSKKFNAPSELLDHLTFCHMNIDVTATRLQPFLHVGEVSTPIKQQGSVH